MDAAPAAAYLPQNRGIVCCVRFIQRNGFIIEFSSVLFFPRPGSGDWKARSPIVVRQVHRRTSDDEAERRRRRPRRQTTDEICQRGSAPSLRSRTHLGAVDHRVIWLSREPKRQPTQFCSVVANKLELTTSIVS